MSEATEPVTLIATFRAADGQDSKISRLIAAYGEVVRNEPGNVSFEIYTDRDDGQAFVIIERYQSEQAFQQHLEGDEGKVFNDQLSPLVEGEGSELQFLRVAS
jgi:quinol monooxygenase YgiN